ncbi:hypothetical protein B0H14DRAFT_3124479 [Mycena olivaceomarginata]|nr:hypothetical protein B0H14DRAFT_3124479 [Mycena olivaceomarginata]
MEHPFASSTKPISRTPVLNERDKGVDCISMALHFLWNKIPSPSPSIGIWYRCLGSLMRLRVIGLDQPTAFYLKVHNIIHAIATSEDPADAGGYWSGLARNSGVLNNSVMIAGEFIQQVVPLFLRGCGARWYWNFEDIERDHGRGDLGEIVAGISEGGGFALGR